MFLLALLAAPLAQAGTVRYYLKVIRPVEDTRSYYGRVGSNPQVIFTSDGSAAQKEVVKLLYSETIPSWSFPTVYALQKVDCWLSVSPYTAYTVETKVAGSSGVGEFSNGDYVDRANVGLPADGIYNFTYTVYVGGAYPELDDLYTAIIVLSATGLDPDDTRAHAAQVNFTGGGPLQLVDFYYNQAGTASGASVTYEYTAAFPPDSPIAPASVSAYITVNGEVVKSGTANFQYTGASPSPEYDNHFFADLSLEFNGGYDETDPEEPVPPIDPTNPPPTNGPVPPSPGVPGGDTNPTTDQAYEAFRNAMEDALDNRELSGQEVHEAVQTALAEQGLSNEHTQNAMENALYNMGITQEDNRDAVQNALSRQGLSASNIASQLSNVLKGLTLNTDGLTQSELGETLDGKGLTGSGIGQAVGDALGGKFGEALGGQDGGGYTGGGDPAGSSYEEGESSVGGDLGQMDPVAGSFIAGQIEGKIRSMFVMQLPQVGRNPVFTMELPGFMGVSLPALTVDLDKLQYVPWVRAVQVFCLYVWAFFTGMRIVGRALS